jgi:hypothetical protein
LKAQIPWLRVSVEGAVIVISILLALAADAWWESRQQAQHRAELIVALRLDFESTKGRLDESIAWADSLIGLSGAFLELARDAETVPLDSLRSLLWGAFQAIEFEPALSSYEAAIATGDLRLVQEPRLLEALAEFRQGQSYFDGQSRVAADLFYLGATWELRREIGSLFVLTRDASEYPPQFRRSGPELRELMAAPEVFASIETITTANRNIRRALNRMRSAASDVITILDTLE